MTPTFQIKLPEFEGPFDLLLFFIERDELDIYDIPIFKITTDFLNYVHHLDILNIELASEFILFAATLMRIKAKMLLPRKEINAQGEEIDPRQELVEKLLEYKKFKAVSEQLTTLESERLLIQKRGNVRSELEAISQAFGEGTEIQNVSLYKLMHTFEKLMKKLKERTDQPQHVVVKYKYSLEGQRNFVVDLIYKEKKVAFEQLFANCENKIHAIFRFLSLLELVQQRFLNLLMGMGRNNFILEYNENTEEHQNKIIENKIYPEN